MKCQYCHQREAVNTFLIALPGGRKEFHLCSECTENARQYYYAMRKMNPIMLAEFEGPGGNRDLGDSPFPQYAGIEIERRRQINQLKAKLQKAVDSERYEEAAKLRDQIFSTEKEVHTV